jgi:Phage derived protein Gp49-like (DUF891)
VLYVAKFDEAVYVLHCFQKKTQRTSKADLNLAALRYRDLSKELGDDRNVAFPPTSTITQISVVRCATRE